MPGCQRLAHRRMCGAHVQPCLQDRRQFHGLAAGLQVDGERIVLTPTAGAFPAATDLLLSLHHPARAQDDVQLRLQPAANGWAVRHGLPDAHDWNLSLAPADGRWRLQGRLPRGQRRAALRPALPAQ